MALINTICIVTMFLLIKPVKFIYKHLINFRANVAIPNTHTTTFVTNLELVIRKLFVLFLVFHIQYMIPFSLIL